ncbi:MAG TPA: hypothetical protein DE060_12510 [Lentisphaeria bacterium]|nr:hypothetical protein [Lentisphaeria bacterium]
MPTEKRTPPYQSRLIPYQKTILEKWFKQRSTLKIIQSWLLEQNVEISLSALSRFIKRRRNRPDPHSDSSLPRKSESASTPSSLDELLNKSPEEIQREWLKEKSR